MARREGPRERKYSRALSFTSNFPVSSLAVTKGMALPSMAFFFTSLSILLGIY